MTKAVAWRRSGDIRTSVTETRWLASVSSWTSPRIKMSDSAWRTCSPTRSSRTERPSGVSTLRISLSRRHVAFIARSKVARATQLAGLVEQFGLEEGQGLAEADHPPLADQPPRPHRLEEADVQVERRRHSSAPSVIADQGRPHACRRASRRRSRPGRCRAGLRKPSSAVEGDLDRPGLGMSSALSSQPSSFAAGGSGKRVEHRRCADEAIVLRHARPQTNPAVRRPDDKQCRRPEPVEGLLRPATLKRRRGLRQAQPERLAVSA